MCFVSAGGNETTQNNRKLGEDWDQWGGGGYLSKLPIALPRASSSRCDGGGG